jgi:hypothetical protein
MTDDFDTSMLPTWETSQRSEDETSHSSNEETTQSSEEETSQSSEEEGKRDPVDRMRRKISDTGEARHGLALLGVSLVILSACCAWCAYTRCQCMYVCHRSVCGTKPLR